MTTMVFGGYPSTVDDSTPKIPTTRSTDPILFKGLILDFIKEERNLCILGWIYKAKDILTVQALETAVALFLKPGCRTLEELNEYRPKITEETLGPLLGTVLKKEKQYSGATIEVVSFANDSVQKFFDQTKFLDNLATLSDGDLELSIAKACVAYLSMDNFRDLPVPPNCHGFRYELQESDTFLTYASRYWHKHIRNSDDAKKLEPDLDKIIDPARNYLCLWTDQGDGGCGSSPRTFLKSRSEVVIKYDLPWLALHLAENNSSELEDVIPAKDLDSLAGWAPNTLKFLLQSRPQYYQPAVTKEVLKRATYLYSGAFETMQVLLGDCENRNLPPTFFHGVASNAEGDKIFEYLFSKMPAIPITRNMLHTACKNRSVGLKILKQFFLMDPTIKITPEMIGCAVGEPEIIQFLLSRDPHVPITEGALMCVLRMECNGESMKTLLDLNASVQVTQKVVNAAVRFNRYEFVKLIFDKFDDLEITEELLVVAAGSDGHELEMAEYLLSLDRCDYSLITEKVINAAMERSNSPDAMTKVLLKYQPHIAISNEMLLRAGEKNWKGPLGVLLDHQERQEVPNAVIDAAIKDRLRSISWGFLKEHYPSNLTILKERVPNDPYLIQCLAETDFTPPPPKDTPIPMTKEDLPNAAEGNDIEKVKQLLEAGININHQHGQTCSCDQNKGVGTALQRAVKHNSREMTKLLLQHGADPNLGHGKYGNPLQTACKAGNIELVRLLLEYKADMNCPGHGHASALHAAAKADDEQVARILLDNGADVNIVDSHGWNPYLHALAYQSLDIVKFFQSLDSSIPAISELIALPPSKLVSTKEAIEYGIHVSEDGLTINTGTIPSLVEFFFS